MKRALVNTLGLIVFGVAGFAAAPTEAQTTANGPYYATPSWDQTLPSATRFIVLSNFDSQAVLDRETGLVWLRSPSSSSPEPWIVASGRCLRLTTTGKRGGWRLPTINELGSLIDPSATTGPALPSGHPFTGLNPNFGSFWSATPSGSGVHFAAGWAFLDTGAFLALAVPDSEPSSHAWCVRGGVLAGSQ